MPNYDLLTLIFRPFYPINIHEVVFYLFTKSYMDCPLFILPSLGNKKALLLHM